MSKTQNGVTRRIIFAAVFTTGAAVLVIEVLATRILAPYYGNTIFTVSSVISAVLGALSAGYSWGGRYADRHADIAHFFRIIFFSGIAALILAVLVVLVLPVGGYFFGLALGPLVWSIILFAPPSFFLGMLSPYAIALLEKGDSAHGIGSVAGAAFFWSTMGSLVGGLGSGFLLIPSFGIRAIMFGVAALLLLLGAAGSWFSGRHTRAASIIPLIAMMAVVSGWSPTFSAFGMTTIFERDGLYEHIRIADGVWEDGRHVRIFFQDRSMSGAMPLAPDADPHILDYTRYYRTYELLVPTPDRAIFLGGGAYTMPKLLFARSTSTMIDIVEIEPSLPELANRYFGLPDDPRLRHVIADGRRYLHDATGTYDLIFSDVYSSLYSIPAHFTTREFFLLARARLSERGVFLANIIGSLAPGERGFLMAEYKTLAEVFPHTYLFAVEDPKSTATQNFVFVGANVPLPYDNAQFAEDPLFETFAAHRVTPDDRAIADASVMTDDFAPVETLLAPLLRKVGEERAGAGDVANTPLRDVETIVSLGARHPTAPGHDALGAMIIERMKNAGAHLVTQKWVHRPTVGKPMPLENIIARWNLDAKTRLLIGTHYDAKAHADKDPIDPKSPLPGANDGASGVAVLFGLADLLAKEQPDVGVDLVFFDAEEGDEELPVNMKGWAPIGSAYFAARLHDLYPAATPTAAVIVDMVCDKDLDLYVDSTSWRSSPQLVRDLWSAGRSIAPEIFHLEGKYAVYNDHTPLIAKEIPSALLTDLDYPPYHTGSDTPDQCANDSLRTVIDTLQTFVYSRRSSPKN